MAKEATGRPSGARKGLFMVNTGDGKGKTTAALGLMFRAWGQGLRVIMFQFVKSRTLNCGEHKAAAAMGIPIIPGGAGRTRKGRVEEGGAESASLWTRAAEAISSGAYDLVVLDEFTYPLRYGWVSWEDFQRALAGRDPEVHVLVTGRGAPPQLVDLADLAVEIKLLKHPHACGVKAQAGIEY